MAALMELRPRENVLRLPQSLVLCRSRNHQQIRDRNWLPLMLRGTAPD